MSRTPPPPFRGRPPAWARAVGRAGLTWLEAVLRPGAKSVPALQEAPRVNQRHPLLVPLDFAPSPDGLFWAIFTPALSHYNGWSEYPDELSRVALVRAAVVADAGPFDLRERQLIADVRDVVPVQELAARFPSAPTGGVPEIPTAHRSARRVERGDLRLYEGNLEGDIAGWLLTHRDVLVLHGFSDFDEDVFCAGHRPLTPAELDALRSTFPAS